MTIRLSLYNMSELPITKRDYDRGILIALFNGEVKRIAELNERISDINFTPVIKGYEITYNKNGIPERLFVNAKSLLYGGLIIKRYVNSKHKKTYRAKDNFKETVIRIFA